MTNTTASIQTVTYSITPTLGGCAGTTQTVSVTVNPSASITAMTNTVCSGLAFSSTPLNTTNGIVPIGTTYSWPAPTLTGGMTGGSTGTNAASITGTLTNTTNITQTATYTVTPTSGTCPGATFILTVTVNPVPSITAMTNTVCSGVAFSSAPINTTNGVVPLGTTYSWPLPTVTGGMTGGATGTDAGSITGTLTNTTSLAQTASYTVTPTSGTCPGATFILTVTVNPLPVMTSTTSTSVCSGIPLNIGLTSNITATYSWIANNNANTTGESITASIGNTINNTITNATATPQTVIYTVTPSSSTAGCPGTPQTVTVTVNPLPIMTSTTSAAVCSGIALNIPLTSNITSNFTWIAGDNINTTGESTTSQTTSTINNTITNATVSTQTVTHTVTPTSNLGGCPGTPQTVTVTVNPLPVITSTTSASVCSGVPLNIGLTSNVASTYSWIATDNLSTSGESTTATTGNTINNTITNTTTTSQTVIYTVTPTSNPAGCVGTPQTVTVTTNPVPVMTSANTATVCSGGAVSIPLTSNIASSYSWIAGDNTNTTGESLTNQTTATISNTITNSSASVQSVVYTVTPTSTTGTCPGTPQTITVTVNPLPNMTSANTATVCSGGAVNINLTSNVASSYSWIAGANANVGGESTTTQTTSSINNTLTNTTASSQTVTYTVTPTSTAGSCPGTPQTVNVTVNPLPNANAGSNQTLTCSSPTVTLTGSSTSSPVSYAWTGPGITAGANTAIASANASGTYTLTVTNTLTGCSNTSTVSVSASAGVPNITMASSPTITCTNSVVTVSGSSSTSGVTYAWSSGVASTNSATTTVNAPGTYTLTVTDPSNSCTNSGTIVVATSTVLPNANAGSNQTITCSTQTVTLSGSSTTSGVNYSWSPGGTTPNSASTNVTASGTYTLTVTNPANGCVNTATVLVNNNTVLPNISTSPSQSLTCSVSNLTLSGSSTTPGVNYLWSPGGTTPNAASTNVSTTGTYTLTVTNPSNGCSAQGTVVVNTNTVAPNVNTGNDQLLTCSQTSVTLTGSSTTTGATFSWEGPNAGTPAGATPNATSTQVSATGTFTLSVTDPSNGCIATDVVVVNPDANLPNVTMGSNQTIICNISSVTLTGNSTTTGVTYLWSGSNGGGTTPALNTTDVNYNGTFTLTVTDPSNGCTNSGTINVTIDTISPNVSAGNPQTLTCSVNSVSLYGSSLTSGVSFLWAPGGSSPNTASTNVSASGTYVLTVTDPSNGCSAQSSVVVSYDTIAPNVNAGNIQVLTCGQTSVTISGSSSTSGASFSWVGPNAGTPAGTSPTSSSTQVSAVGVYTLSVTNPSNGCSATDTVSVLPDANLPNVSAGNDAIISCNNSSASLNGSSSTSGVTYAWSGPLGFSSASSIVNVSGTGTYTLVVTNPLNNCSSTDFVDVIDSTQAPNVSAGTDITLTCVVTSASISGSSTTNPVGYSWNGPSGFTSTSANNSVTTIGDYTLTVTNLTTGCSSTDIVSVLDGTNVPNVNPGTSQTINCINLTVSLNGSSTTANAQFSWSGPNGLSSSVSNPSVGVDGVYSLTVTDPVTGCTNNASVTVLIDTITPDVNIAVSEDTLNCLVTSSLLTGSSNTPGVVMIWNLTSNNPATVNAPGTYALAVSNPVNECSVTQTVTVYQNITPPSVSVFSSDDTLNCAIPTISLGVTGSNGYSYSWSGPNSFSSSQQNPSNQVNTAGTYSLAATNPQNGCSSNLTINIYQGSDPVVGFTSNPSSGIAPLNVQFTNTSTSGFTSYLWDFGYTGANSNQVNPSNIYNQPGTYTVQLIGFGTGSNCNDTTFATIIVYPESTILTPNIFSPNGDGTNEFFFISSSGLKDLHVDIYDRWGLKVGEINGPNWYWDGNGASEGTYFFVLNATGYDNKPIEKQGYLMLVK